MALFRTPLLQVLGVALAFAAAAQTAHANAIYTYTGNDFNLFTGVPSTVFNTSDRVTATITTIAALAPNLSEYLISSYAGSTTTWSFSDGVDTLTNSDNPADVGGFFWVSTDSSGNIDQWDFSIESEDGEANIIITCTANPSCPTAEDLGSEGPAYLNYPAGRIVSDPGSWAETTSGAATPEPSTGIMAILGVLALRQATGRRRFRGRRPTVRVQAPFSAQ
jgi:hypothetical protein